MSLTSRASVLEFDTSPGMHLEQAISHAAVSDVGMRRRNNEDACVAQTCPDVETWRSRGHLFVVADGMGGHAVGELASKLAVDTVPHTFFKSREGQARTAIAQAVAAANAAIHSRGSQNRDFQRMGTTCTALALTPHGALVAHVGDSRCYRIRRDRIDQLTFDHSMIWELARHRGIPPEKVDLVEHRNVITRSLGPEANVQVDVEGPVLILPGDVYVLCTDGLTSHLHDEEIASIVRELSPNQASRLLVQLANYRGGSDNCTVIVVRVGDLPANVPPPPMPMPEGAELGWGWLAVFWGIALGIVGGLSLAMFGHPFQGIFIGSLCLVGLIIALIAFLKEQKRQQPDDRDDLSQTIINRPHRTAVAMTSEELSRMLALVDSDLTKTAQEDEWEVKWGEHQTLVDTAREAFERKRFTKAARDYARAIDLLMTEFIRHRGSPASTT